ncbi:CPBP family intramembrane glutamic endopeptidase [Pseudalkalibacillus salsuginis]|uniref:CPBP family intramembrane glutamic endopeptidase n=1 Tax=Pseudalkalibacillus salsuginis TaxID=2910972 RepID=UPI001F1A73FD|nr:type II CAAX endopeptidase family protein [Pseudalkalibacillus salsuginis]MCF6411492.1 CPBP family intramembrane metalloprotease [Pseudalkalibacillus salsuginis]
MNKRYAWILITYIVMLLSGIVGGPILLSFDVPRDQIPGLWNVISFTIGLIIIFILLIPEFKKPLYRDERVNLPQTIGWAILGVPMVFIAQIIAASIEMKVFGVEPGSKNTEMIIDLTLSVPLLILVVSVIGPILEEIVFRKVIFGTIYKRTNFIIAASISSLIFAVVHRDFSHLLVYAALGFTFSFLYVKTKRLIVPIVAHVAVNTSVMLIQVVFRDEIQELERQLQSTQLIIGGLL